MAQESVGCRVTWNNPALAYLFSLAGDIPLKRSEADVDALRRGLEALEAGYIVAVAPEGTRSGDGMLRRGKPGAAILALRSSVPLLPLAYYGHEVIWRNLRRLRRTDFHIRVGRPFCLDAGGVRVTREARQQMADEIMWQIAALLPLEYRGYYADGGKATEACLRFRD